MELGRAVRPHTTALAVATSVFLALVGLGMAIYLLSVRWYDANRFREQFSK